MAIITLQNMYDAWKKVSDWVSGADTVSAPAVKLVGGKVNQKDSVLTLFNALAITDTTLKWYGGGVNAQPIPNWNNYNRRVLFVRNTHDQAVRIVLAIRATGTTGYYEMSKISGGSYVYVDISVPAGGTNRPILITSADIPVLDKISPREVSMYVVSSVAPTTGSITVELIQWAE